MSLIIVTTRCMFLFAFIFLFPITINLFVHFILLQLKTNLYTKHSIQFKAIFLNKCLSKFVLRSFFIQNFADSFRQCIIDLMQGKLVDANELKEDEVMKTILHIFCPSTPAPTRGYYNAGVLGPELHFLENIVYTRCAAYPNPQAKSKSRYLVHLVAPFVSVILVLSFEKVFLF